MHESALWAWGTPIGLGVLGASAGLVLLAAPPDFLAAAAGAGAFLGSVFFVAVFLSCAFALQIYRRRGVSIPLSGTAPLAGSRVGPRGLDASPLVASASSALALFAFFAAPFALDLSRGVPLDEQGALLLLVVVPLLAAAVSGAGALVLAGGVERYRAQHGLRHAPGRRS